MSFRTGNDSLFMKYVLCGEVLLLIFEWKGSLCTKVKIWALWAL